MRTLHRFYRQALPALAVLLCLAPSLSARTLTSADGRKIEVEVLGYEPGAVRVKRTDTGQIFTLPLEKLSAEDADTLRAEAKEAAKKAAEIQAKDVLIEVSRTKFDTRKKKEESKLTDGRIIKDGRTVTEEDWGYNITLRNQTSAPIEGLRAEYILFVKKDVPDGHVDKNKLKRTKGSLTFTSIAPGARATERTDAVVARSVKLADGIVFAGSDGDDRMRDTLVGAWLRIYQGDRLVIEQASPGSLSSTEKW